MGNPVESLGLSDSVKQKISYTGYLDREIPDDRNWIAPVNIDDPYILVTAGGGGDGVEMIDWVISAYETDPQIPHRAIIVTGPFMQVVHQQEFHDRCDALDNVEIITFNTHMELLMERAVGVVAMGGYNTFCEILSLDKLALIVPRSVPRQEQLIRASRAAGLGLVSMLDPSNGCDPAIMAAALYKLPDQRPPSEYAIPGMLDGHDNVAKLVRQRLEAPMLKEA
jgi:predicted glycosyltransferase